MAEKLLYLIIYLDMMITCEAGLLVHLCFQISMSARREPVAVSRSVQMKSPATAVPVMQASSSTKMGTHAQKVSGSLVFFSVLC